MQTARQPDQAKLARIAIMVLNFQSILRMPGQPDSPARTMDLFDIPQMYADVYGVHNIELQHNFLSSTDDSYLKELKARAEKTQSRYTNINLELGQMNISQADPVQRTQAIDLTKRWVDHAVTLGSPRVMINQGALSHENKHYAIPALKMMVDYGRSQGVMVSVETRGNGAGSGGGAAQPTPAAAPTSAPPPAAPVPADAPAGGAGARAGGGGGRGQAARPPAMTAIPGWVLLAELIKDAGSYANVDVGGVGAADQGELHAALRTLMPMTVNNMHTRVSPVWDLATAIRFLVNDLHYTGLFSIEVNNGHEGIRPVYNIVLDTL